MKTYPIRDVTGDKYLNPATKFISFSSLKAFGGVVFLMLALSEQLKILNSIIRPIFVHVMNMLVFSQLPAYMLFHYMAMLIHEKVVIVYVTILHALTSLVVGLPLGIRLSLVLHGTAPTTKNPLTTVVMNTLEFKLRRAKSTLHNIVKPSLFARYFSYNNSGIHTIIILQGAAL